MRRISLLVITILLLSGLAGFGGELQSEEGFNSPFGFMPAEFDFEHARGAGAYWDRPFFELFQWGMIEPQQGRFSFHMTDRYIRRAQRHGFHILANIQPFAPWDQEGCHEDLPAITSPMGPQTKGKPCNIEAYKNFVIKLIERYDGDGQDDMPGLKYPIKCWEVANEPEMQRQPLVFFQGSPQDYFEILKATYEAVKEADSRAQVVQGGMAGMDRWMVSFWQKVFDLGAASYFDIANIHSIGHGEHLNIPSFKKFLSKNNASEKPFWVTEVQIEDRKRKRTPQEYAASLARSYIFALANGAKKLFYVNLRLPEYLPPEEEGGPGFSDLSTLVDSSGNLTPLFYAHHTIASKLEGFQKMEKIKERVKGRTILEGRYRFVKDNKVIYVLWGRGKLPSEIEGKVRVTDISGREEILTSDSVRLTNSPIFVEKIEPPSEAVTVIQVIDGDTCLLEGGRCIRYLGINAPERDDPLFEEATRANNKLVGGKAKITLRTGSGKNTDLELFWGSRRPIWNNDGDTIFIRDADGNLILSYVY